MATGEEASRGESELVLQPSDLRRKCRAGKPYPMAQQPAPGSRRRHDGMSVEKEDSGKDFA